MNQTGFSRTISTEDKGEGTDGEPLGVSEGFEIPEAEAGEHGLPSRFANANAATGYHYQGSPKIMQIQPLKGNPSQLNVASATFFIQAEEQDSGMTSRRIAAQVGKTFIGRDQPSSLFLHERPQFTIWKALPSLHHYCQRIVTSSGKEVGNLSWEVFIDLDSNTHACPCPAKGMKSAWLTASAANLNAA